jgi:hypothetical protein
LAGIAPKFVVRHRIVGEPLDDLQIDIPAPPP